MVPAAPTTAKGDELEQDQDIIEIIVNKEIGSKFQETVQMDETSSVDHVLYHVPKSKDLSTLREFQYQNHSLRINVSELAACAGFHPYKCLPKLFYEHVYQGILGQALLHHDAELLGMKIVSDQQIWKELAQKAGAATQKALTQAIQVQTGQTKVVSVEAADALRRSVVQEAKSSQRLTPQQLATLEEGARHTIHTGFGTIWESQALDLYEKHCGWEVTERNTEVRVWDFDNDGKELGPARPSYSRHKPTHLGERDSCESDEQHHEQKSEKDMKRQKVGASHENLVLFDLTRSTVNIIHEEPFVDHNGFDTSMGTTPLPFFSLRGSIDGIREEMAPTPKESSCCGDEFDDDVTWALRQVVVECKHRMHQLQPVPPLYEMIQATAYCLMYEAQEADILQVLRKEHKKVTKPHADNQQRDKRKNELANKITNYISKERPKAGEASTKDIVTSMGEIHSPAAVDRIGAENQISPASEGIDRCDDRLEMTTTQITKEVTLEAHTVVATTPNNVDISVCRISIDDPLFQHRQNWFRVVLPRLRSWTEAVYAVRKDDNKRYQLLVALSEERLHDAWGVLLHECTWLRDCDTSFSRDVCGFKSSPS